MTFFVLVTFLNLLTWLNLSENGGEQAISGATIMLMIKSHKCATSRDKGGFIERRGIYNKFVHLGEFAESKLEHMYKQSTYTIIRIRK